MNSNAARSLHADESISTVAPRDARAAVGVRPPWQTITIDGVRLAYSDDGTGPAIVCLHAIGHGAGDFTRLRERLRSRYRVVALDWPGQGHSGDDHVPASAPHYTELLDGLLTSIDASPVVIVGNSIGGTVAVRLAAEHPTRVRALILANPGRLDRTDFLTALFTRAMARFFTAGARGAWWYPRAFAAYYRMILVTPAAAEQRARIVAAGRDVAPILAQAWRSFGMPGAEIGPLAPQVRCPVLFTWAKRDRINQLSRARRAIGQFPNARLELFDAGHSPFLETPEEFDAALDRFLTTV